ncbi:long-chain-fatty-acid--CoA ligase [Maritimibacter sp. DP07]|uniref:3-methylmercaptopropionyl-CoA ligase n=1 Tax=Maritimibacter harenae TaxID=2606218 RepID=A0A845M3X0_9RHOB|nr:long-chain-fatty-acid--CoA ligase [Maritimibacter harenae]MZR12183.1 long-chain-fatty-acid--CoA ligase [Maritimibacter harenae]
MSGVIREYNTFADVIRRHAQERPDAPALTFKGDTHSFAQLHDATSRTANMLASRGVGPGDRVALISRNRPEMFELIYACNKLGAVLAPLNWRLSQREIAQILSDCMASVVIVDEIGEGLLPDESSEVPVLRFGPDFDEARAAASGDDPGHSGGPDETALILYTSGTTGLPKGVMLTNRGMSYTRELAKAWGMDSESVNLVAMPLFHIGGCGYGSSTMLAGGHTVLMAEVDVLEILALIPRHRVTHTFLVPAVVQSMLNAPEVADADLQSLQLLMYGAAPMGDVLLRRAMDAFGCKFMHAYGMTETSGTVVILEPESHDPDGPRSGLLKSCGRALPWVELRVVDPATGKDAMTGDVGEIWLRTPMVMKGYWQNATATREAITAEGWFRTGDAAYLDEEGHVFLFDRFKDMIISGGENIYPAEIENVLNGHPAVAEVGVIGVAHEKWGETPLAVVVRKAGQAADAGALIAYTRKNLATYKCPSRIVFVESLPRNASGKLLKHVMRDTYGATS